ncbi:RING finger protein 145-like [Mytilus trossulus]|uniref:RING finger protein 145-like n=1 Tax=Mytilus trossulus TaxID=6551 RepID=UPI003003F119
MSYINKQKIIKVLLTTTQIICGWVFGESNLFERFGSSYLLLQTCLGLLVCFFCNINTQCRFGVYLYCFVLAGSILQDELSWFYIIVVILISVVMFIQLHKQNYSVMFDNFNKFSNTLDKGKVKFVAEFTYPMYYVLMFIVALIYNYCINDLSELGVKGQRSILLSTLGMCCCTILSSNAMASIIVSISKRLLKVCYLTVTGTFEIEGELVLQPSYIFSVIFFLINVVISDMGHYERGQLVVSRLLLILALFVSNCLLLIETMTSKVEFIQGNMLTCVRVICIQLMFVLGPAIIMYYMYCHYTMDNLGIFLTMSSYLTNLIFAVYILFLYILFKYDAICQTFWDGFDNLVFNIRIGMGIFIILIQICTVVFSVWTLFFGFYSWLELLRLGLISYVNIYIQGVRIQRVISHKKKIREFINNLVDATSDRLAGHQDVCSICFQGLEEAKVTQCDHLFHESCIRKWLNVRLTCPLCQMQIIL